jgi:hypothetical protein
VRGGAAAVEDFAAERAVQDYPKLDRRLSVPDGVGDELADQQLGREGHFWNAPGGQLARGPGASLGDDRRVGGQVPADDPVRRQGPGAGHEQGGVIYRRLGKQLIDQAVADGIQRCGGIRGSTGLDVDLAQDLAHRIQPGVDVPVILARFDQPVGVQDEQAALGQLDLGLLEGQPAQAQREADRQVEILSRAVRGHDGRNRMAGPGQRAATRHRVVYGVQARRAEVGGGVGRQLLLGRQPRDHIVEPGEQLFRGQVNVRERPDRGAEPAHGRGGVDAVPDHVADHEAHPAPR